EGEQHRMLAEEAPEQAFELAVYPWNEPDLSGIARRLAAGRLAADTALPAMEPLAAEFAALRGSLTPAEVARCRELAIRMGIAMTRACFEVRPGLSEQHIAAMLAGDLYGFGVMPVAVRVATDERVHLYGNAPPTGR